MYNLRFQCPITTAREIVFWCSVIKFVERSLEPTLIGDEC